VPVTDAVEVQRGRYYDSVTLMQVSTRVGALDGVQAALVAMGTDLNQELLTGMGFPRAAAGPTDLVVAVRARDERALAGARAALEAELTALVRPSGAVGPLGGPPPPRTVGTAARRVDADVALVSVPGPYAFVEAMDALDAGLSVMVFSDNVPVDAEVRLKAAAAQRGLLVMGPDAGTALVHGVGLGFANVVSPGPVSLVAASGTGAQQLMCLLDAAGVGVRHCLGVGGRDLSAPVAGASTLAALRALDADEGTELIAVVSKPAAPQVADAVREAARGARTPVVLLVVGEDGTDLTAGAERLLDRLGRPVPAWPSWHPPAPVPATDVAAPGAVRRAVRGLFSGGTLCEEAMTILSRTVGPVASNVAGRPEWRVGPGLAVPAAVARGHRLLDLGDDAFTRGRAHPMIDPSLRLDLLRAELADPATAVVLLDVVLGLGAHPDPAAGVAEVIRGAAVPVVVSLIGTVGDPQGLTGQAQALVEAGAHVYLSNAAAARHAATVVSGRDA
jgi:FdrA protein